MDQIKVYNEDDLPTIDYTQLEDLQEDLKIINPSELKKLKQSIIKYGIRMPKFVWLKDNIYWTLDGHQTKKALSDLSKEYIIPKIPVAKIKAKNKKEAKDLLLVINSRYGSYNLDSIFINKIKIPTIINIPELKHISYFNAEEEWQDMPEYKVENLQPYRTIYVHFNT